MSTILKYKTANGIEVEFPNIQFFVDDCSQECWVGKDTLDDGLRLSSRVYFANNYAISFVRHAFSLSTEETWELAVMTHDGDILYDTPITDNVLGYQHDYDVVSTCYQVSQLEKRKEAEGSFITVIV